MLFPRVACFESDVVNMLQLKISYQNLTKITRKILNRLMQNGLNYYINACEVRVLVEFKYYDNRQIM